MPLSLPELDDVTREHMPREFEVEWADQPYRPARFAERVATGEFNTWYVRGLAARCIAEGIDVVMVYWPRGETDAFTVPFGPACHHSIRLVS